jgi:hypothetical protein
LLQVLGVAKATWLVSLVPRARLGAAALGDAGRALPAVAGGEDPNWKDLILFNEYFHGDRARDRGASHQTGWTSLVAVLAHALSEARRG